MTTDERIESLTSTTVYGDNLEWLISELRRARHALTLLASYTGDNDFVRGIAKNGLGE